MNFIIPKKVQNIMELLISNKYEAYIVGGAVRDYFLGVKPHDYDIFTNATGEEILKIFPTGKIIGGEERQEKILTVVVNDVEVSQYRINGDRTKTGLLLVDHLATCDYNINAMAIDIDGAIIDMYNGRESLGFKRFEFVGDGKQRIIEDPLRLMRGLRLILQCGLTPTEETVTTLIKEAKQLELLPQERIRDEIMKLLRYEECYDILLEYGFLKYVLPEMYDLVGLDAGPHHNEKDCFEHSNIAFKNSCKLTTNTLLRFANSVHDVGKKPTAKVIDGNITFHNHQIIGEQMVHKLMKRLKFSKHQRNYVATIVRQHMMGPVNKMRDVTFAKICDDLNQNNVDPEDMIIMTYSDNQANLTKVRLPFHSFIKQNPFLRKYYEFSFGRKPFNKTDLEISGKDLITIGIPVGPDIGKKLTEIYEAVHEGKVINRRDKLLEFIKNGI